MYVMFIYGEARFEYQQNLWNRITSLVLDLTPLLIIGDFNQVELFSDKLGGTTFIRGQRDFTVWKINNGLMDVPFFGPWFTWMNSQHNIWETPFFDSSMFVLSRKLAMVRRSILQWVINHQISHGINWSDIETDMDLIAAQIIDEQSATSYLRLRTSRLQLFKVKQRATKHRILALRSADGVWLESPDSITCEIVNYFKGLLCRGNTYISTPLMVSEHPLLSGLDLPMLSPVECSLLQASFSEHDVLCALRGMDALKSPGPDGITPKFFQTFWPQIGDLVTSAILRFLNSGVMLKEWNNTTIVLIPKIDKPELVSQYRPISLCNFTYRLASKCMANRLKLVIPSIILDSQQAFVPDRLMSDGCVIAHEIMHYLNKTTKGTNCYSVLKLYMHKAFDRVSWQFLMSILERFGFPITWRNLIWECISMVTYSILINGEPSPSFYPSCGLRQGQMINLDKSFIKFSLNSPADFKSHMTSILRMKASSSFGAYLGVPVDLAKRKTTAFHGFLDKFTTRISSLSSLHLSQASKFVIINSIFLGSLVHILAAVPLPLSVSRKLDSLIAAFCPWVQGKSPNLRRNQTTNVPAISDLICDDGSWKPQLVFDLFEQSTAKDILAMEQPVLDSDDFLYWKYTEDGSYNIHSGYMYLLSKRSTPPPLHCSFPWKLVWLFLFSSKFPLFIWRLANNILPTKTILAHRGLRLDTLRPLCRCATEIPEHLFRSCDIIQHLWRSSMLGIRSLANPSTLCTVLIYVYLTYAKMVFCPDQTLYRKALLSKMLYNFFLHISLGLLSPLYCSCNIFFYCLFTSAPPAYAAATFGSVLIDHLLGDLSKAIFRSGFSTDSPNRCAKFLKWNSTFTSCTLQLVS
ncbi:uncharacterized protein LOC141595098 [Silene latifolia]|uniref:uncharacterized protein LOC141595098 n=1 Tax=Silene latifolia TaxID=37657 RepID=UPI003D78263A